MTSINWDQIQGIVDAQFNDYLADPKDPNIEWPLTQILEVVPSDNGNGFKVIYSGTPASITEPNGITSGGPNKVPGIDFWVGVDDILGITSEYNPSIDTAGFIYLNPSNYRFDENSPNGYSHIIEGQLVDFMGNFPNAQSLPVTILEFDTPSQSGPTYVEIDSAIGFTPLLEYSDSFSSPSLIKLDPTGNGEIANLLDDTDVIFFEVPEGVEIEEITLTDYIGADKTNSGYPLEGRYYLYNSTNAINSGSDISESALIANGLFVNGYGAGYSDYVVSTGENLLVDGETTSTPLTAGKYTLVIEPQTADGRNPVNEAYRFQLSPGLSIPEISVDPINEGDSLNVILPALSSDGQSVSWSANPENFPAGLEIQNNVVSGSLADENYNGILSIVVTAEAGGTNKDITLSIEVQPVNDAPTLLTSLSDQTLVAFEDSEFSFTIPAGTFNDIDAGDSLTLSASSPDGSDLPNWISFDPSTRTFTGTPLNENVGAFDIEVTATDSSEDENNSVSDLLTISVENTNDAPIIAEAIDDQIATEDSLYEFIVPIDTFTDVDAGDVLELTASGPDGSDLPNWLVFDTDAATFTGTPLNENVGAFDIEVTATDSSDSENNSVVDSFTINVNNTNDKPIIDIFDFLTGVEDLATETKYTDLIEYHFWLTDPDVSDAESLFYVIGDILEENGSLEIFKESATGYRQANDGDTIEEGDSIRWQANDNANEYIEAFTLYASDDEGELSEEAANIGYVVFPQDDAPTLLVNGVQHDNITDEVIESENWSQQLSYSEVDGDNVAWQILGDDAVHFSIDTDDVLSFKGTADFENKEQYNIEVSIVDDTTEKLSDTINLELNVKDRPDQTLKANTTSAYIPGDQYISLDFKYSQETPSSNPDLFNPLLFGDAEDFAFNVFFDSTQLELIVDTNSNSDLHSNGNFSHGSIETDDGVSTIKFTSNDSASDLPHDIGILKFKIVNPDFIEDFKIDWTVEPDVSAGYDSQDTGGSIIISPDPDVFNEGGFLDLSAFENDRLKLDLSTVDLDNTDVNGELVTEAYVELVQRENLNVDLILNLPFEEVVLTQNDDQLLLPSSELLFHLGDGDDVLASPQWSLRQDEQFGSAFGFLGSGADVVEIFFDEHATSGNFEHDNSHNWDQNPVLEGKRWGVLDFEFGIDSIKMVGDPSNLDETLYEHRHDIIELIKSEGFAERGFTPNFAPMIGPVQTQYADPNSEFIIASKVSPLLPLDLQIEPGTIATGDLLELTLTEDSDAGVRFNVAGLNDADSLIHGDWKIQSFNDSSIIAISYQRDDNDAGFISSGSYNDFLQLARKITVDIGDLDEASFDVNMEWINNSISITEAESGMTDAVNFTPRQDMFLLSEVLSESYTDVATGLQVKTLENGDFTNDVIQPIKLDVVAPLRQGQPTIIRGSELDDSITMIGDVVQQLQDGPNAGLSSAVAYGRGGVDTLIGKDGTRLVGGDDTDYLFAELGSGTAQLVGGDDHDVLVGGENDVLMGGRGDDDIVLRGLGARVFTGSGADTIMIDQASFGRLQGSGVSRVMDFTTDDEIVVNMPGLRRQDLVVDKQSTGVLIQVAEHASALAEALGSHDLMLIQGVSDKQIVEDRLSVTSNPDQFTDPLLANLNPGTVGTLFSATNEANFA